MLLTHDCWLTCTVSGNHQWICFLDNVSTVPNKSAVWAHWDLNMTFHSALKWPLPTVTIVTKSVWVVQQACSRSSPEHIASTVCGHEHWAGMTLLQSFVGNKNTVSEFLPLLEPQIGVTYLGVGSKTTVVLTASWHLYLTAQAAPRLDLYVS